MLDKVFTGTDRSYVINPATRRKVKTGSLIGRAVLGMAEYLESNPDTNMAALYLEKCPDGRTWDPSTRRCVTTVKNGRNRALRAFQEEWNLRRSVGNPPRPPPRNTPNHPPPRNRTPNRPPPRNTPNRPPPRNRTPNANVPMADAGHADLVAELERLRLGAAEHEKQRDAAVRNRDRLAAELATERRTSTIRKTG